MPRFGSRGVFNVERPLSYDSRNPQYREVNKPCVPGKHWYREAEAVPTHTHCADHVDPECPLCKPSSYSGDCPF